ncbi:unnamed protein product [Onchocerca flexuosa]|uniref:Uncharacterized protein n=1 Tax=Onchocerca flexuosa TaxID=387005 RepID=A0A183I802_9BILA|nr:unnamed protein product [Onchocerca flexuosa]
MCVYRSKGNKPNKSNHMESIGEWNEEAADSDDNSTMVILMPKSEGRRSEEEDWLRRRGKKVEKRMCECEKGS